MHEDPEQTSATITAKLKAQTIKQIFKNLSHKNLKGVEYFYFLCCKDNLELQFISSAKDIMISIVLKKNLFGAYNCPENKLFKFALSDFTHVYYLFENNKHLLDITLEPQKMTIVYETYKGKTYFIAIPLHCDEDDTDFLIDPEELRPNQASLEMRLARVGMLQGISSYAKGCKLQSLWFRYDSVGRMLVVTDKKEDPEIVCQLKLEQVRLNMMLNYMEINSKILQCALNLLPKDNELIMTFYSTFLLLDVPQNQRYFTIKLNSKVELS